MFHSFDILISQPRGEVFGGRDLYVFVNVLLAAKTNKIQNA